MMHEAGTATEQTRARLLDAAREVFSQHGLQGATVREICRRAEANVAAVNYHFGSKDGLLAEALNFAPLKAMQLANIEAGGAPEMRLRLFIRDFMLILLHEIAGEKTGEAELRRCMHSILGQCLYYRHSHPVLQRLHPRLRYDQKEIAAIALHIADFSLAGINAISKPAAK